MAKKTYKTTKKECVTRVCTVNLHKRLYAVSHTRKASRAVKAIRDFAAKSMGTRDVKIDVDLNRHLWERGIRHVPNRVRVKLSRRRHEDEQTKEEFYTLVSLVPTNSFKGLENKTILE